MSKRDRIVFDLFAGCGGLTTGLEKAEFKCGLVSELDEFARQSFIENRHDMIGEKRFSDLTDLHFANINEIDEIAIKRVRSVISVNMKINNNFDVDLLTGGPPCQGYSGIGHRRNYHVERKDIPSNKLYEPMAKIIEIVKPKIFLFENVRGILSGRWTVDGQKGEIWNDVLKRFRNISGYSVRWSLVEAKNYGVPQNRPRVLLVGIRNDIIKSANLELKLDEHDAVSSGFLPKYSDRAAPDLIDLLSDLLDSKTEKILLSQNFPQKFESRYYNSEPRNSIQEGFRTKLDGSIIGKGSMLTEQEYSKHKPLVVEKFKSMHLSNGEIAEQYKTKKFSQRLLPMRWGNKGPTITATSLPDDYVHFCQPRILTVREWARLQTFPDWYTFAGKRTTGGLRRAGNPTKGIFERELPKYTQIGNAVPVWLAEAVGRHFADILNKSENLNG